METFFEPRLTAYKRRLELLINTARQALARALQILPPPPPHPSLLPQPDIPFPSPFPFIRLLLRRMRSAAPASCQAKSGQPRKSWWRPARAAVNPPCKAVTPYFEP